MHQGVVENTRLRDIEFGIKLTLWSSPRRSGRNWYVLALGRYREEVEVQSAHGCISGDGSDPEKGIGIQNAILMCGTLWLQDKELRNLLELTKVKGAHNVADIMANNVSK